MNVVALAPYPEEAPSTRFRLAQLREPLAARGIHLRIEPFMTARDADALYAGASLLRRAAVVTRGLRRRWHRLGDPDRPDLFLVHREISPLLARPLLRRLLETGVPVAYDFDDAVYLHPAGGDRLLRALRSPRRDTAALCRTARVVLAGNRWLADFAEAAREAPPNVPEPAVTVVPTVVDTDRFRPPTERPVDSERRPVVGWVGSHSTLPDLVALLPVLREARRRVDFTLRVVCNREPPVVEGLEIDFVPWTPEREVEVFHGLDVGLYPLEDSPWSRGKCGFKAIEYLACGVPAVASPVGVVPDIVVHGETGLLARDADGWIDAVTALLADSEGARRMGERGRERVMRRYSVESILPSVADLLRRAAGLERG